MGIAVPRSSTISLSSKLRCRRRGAIRIGEETLIAFKTLILATDPVTGQDRPIRIGARCFIGGGATILGGVTIGDGSIVAAGSVIVDDVPPGAMVGGNPARLIRSGIATGPRGRLRDVVEVKQPA